MTGAGEAWRLGHRPALDGVRGLAILLVLAGHTNFPGMQDGGKGGVAVFFALSGFLITSLLLEEHADSGRVDLRRFFARRAYRLLPAQLVALAVTTLLVLPLGARYLTVTDSVEALLYVRNLTDPGGVLGHYWSLAVEEQFYLVWGPLLVLALAKIPHRWMLPLILTAASGSAAARIYFADEVIGSVHLRYSLPLMVDGLLLGAALAFFLHRWGPGLVARWVTPVGLVGVLGLTALAHDVAGAWRMLATGALAVVLIWAATAQPAAWLMHPVLRWFGRRSYAIYLWHYPLVFVMAVRFGIDSFAVLGPVVIVASCAAAELSWRFVEAPMMKARESRLTVMGHQRGVLSVASTAAVKGARLPC